jgi:FkbM family methyltransferase
VIAQASRVAALVRQPDFRANPPRAVWRRLRWRAAWRNGGDSVVLSDWWDGVSIALPHSGSAARLFYDRGAIARRAELLASRLHPGATAVDVGAHAGEYALVCAKLVGPTGRVFAFEPQETCRKSLARSAELNGFGQLEILGEAVADTEGEASFESDPRSLGGWMTRGHGRRVRTVTLDGFLAERGLSELALLKLDAAGNESAVVRGASRLLGARRCRTVLCKLYDPSVSRERFGVGAPDHVDALIGYGYRVAALEAGMSPIANGERALEFVRDGYGTTLIATADAADG